MQHKSYYIFLTDIIRSRQLADNRQAATKKLKVVLNEINSKYSSALFAPLEITRGDEAAAVLFSVEQLYDIIITISNTLLPFHARFAVSYNTLTAGITSRKSSEMDGPAFYIADEVMNKMKKTQKVFQLNTGNDTLDFPITSLVNMLLFRREQCTDFQRNVADMYRKGLKQNEIANKLKRSQQQVSQAMRALPADIYFESEENVSFLLKSLHSQLKKKK
ncbi:MAG: hypothetical protein HYZ33_00235 [Ignavibacteriales bacterium]|nr:hypothetical protein [Ignavibacteriales bacterium]